MGKFTFHTLQGYVNKYCSQAQALTSYFLWENDWTILQKSNLVFSLPFTIVKDTYIYWSQFHLHCRNLLVSKKVRSLIATIIGSGMLSLLV